MAAPTPDSAGDEAGQLSARARAELSAAQTDCRALYALLPEAPPWHGAASAAFRLRVAALRERLELSCAALAAAEAEL